MHSRQSLQSRNINCTIVLDLLMMLSSFWRLRYLLKMFQTTFRDPVYVLEPRFNIFRDLFQILKMQNKFLQFCSVHQFLYINCSHLCYFRQLCNKDCIWSSENEILILEVLERCLTLYMAGEIHGHIFLSSK